MLSRAYCGQLGRASSLVVRTPASVPGFSLRCVRSAVFCASANTRLAPSSAPELYIRRDLLAFAVGGWHVVPLPSCCAAWAHRLLFDVVGLGAWNEQLSGALELLQADGHLWRRRLARCRALLQPLSFRAAGRPQRVHGSLSPRCRVRGVRG